MPRHDALNAVAPAVTLTTVGRAAAETAAAYSMAIAVPAAVVCRVADYGRGPALI
jgi:hypothetical protein